jgi:hypothetical protein
MHTPISPDIERLYVSDLYGLITRRVVALPDTPSPVAKPIPKSPPVPAISSGASALQQAFGIYNGWIDFDHWLNLSTTTWSQAKKVLRILMGDRAIALTYLRDISLHDDKATAGQLAGKIMAMQAICIFRELHQHITDHTGTTNSNVTKLAAQLNHALFLTRNTNDLVKQIFVLGPQCPTLDDFELKLLSNYWPVNNLVHARRILKSRVKKVVMDDFYNLLLRKDLDIAFTIHYLTGVYNRLYFFNADSRGADQSIQHLQKIIQLYKQIIHTDPLFVRQTFILMFSGFINNRSFRSEPLFAWYFFRTIYHAAIQGKSLREMMQSMMELSRSMEVNIYFRPHSLAMIYRALPFYDLRWANQELEDLVIVKVN